MPSTYQVELDRTELNVPSSLEYLVEFESDDSIGSPEIDGLQTTSYTYVEIDGRFYSLDDNGEPDYSYELILADDEQRASFETALGEAQTQVVEIADQITQVDGHEAWLILTYAPGEKDPAGRQLIEVSSRTELRPIEPDDETEPDDSPDHSNLGISDYPTQPDFTGPSGDSIDELMIADFEFTMPDSGRYDVVFEAHETDEELVEPVANVLLAADLSQDIDFFSDTTDSQRTSPPVMRHTGYGQVHRQNIHLSEPALVTSETSPSVDQLPIETPGEQVLDDSQHGEHSIPVEESYSPMEVFDEMTVISEQAADVSQGRQSTNTVERVESALALDQTMEQYIADNSAFGLVSSNEPRPIEAATARSVEYSVPPIPTAIIDTVKQSLFVEAESVSTLPVDMAWRTSVDTMTMNRGAEITRHVSDRGPTPVDVDIDLAMTKNHAVVESDRSVIIALEPTRTDDEIRFETSRSTAAVVGSVASDLAVIFANQATKPDAPVAAVESVRPVMTRAVESSSDVPVASYRTIQPVIDGDTVLAVPDAAEPSVTINEAVGASVFRQSESTVAATVGSSDRQSVVDEHLPETDPIKPIWLAQTEATESAGWQSTDISPVAASFDRLKNPTISQPTSLSLTDDDWGRSVNDDRDIVFGFQADSYRPARPGQRLARMEASL